MRYSTVILLSLCLLPLSGLSGTVWAQQSSTPFVHDFFNRGERLLAPPLELPELTPEQRAYLAEEISRHDFSLLGQDREEAVVNAVNILYQMGMDDGSRQLLRQKLQ
jgi:hypothetical protein